MAVEVSDMAERTWIRPGTVTADRLTEVRSSP